MQPMPEGGTIPKAPHSCHSRPGKYFSNHHHHKKKKKKTNQERKFYQACSATHSTTMLQYDSCQNHDMLHVKNQNKACNHSCQNVNFTMIYLLFSLSFTDDMT